MIEARTHKIQPADGWWGDEDGGIFVHVWGDPLPQGVVKVSYVVAGIEYWDHVPADQVMPYEDWLVITAGGTWLVST